MCSSGNPTWHRKSPRYYFRKAKTAPWNVSLRLICQLSVSPNHLRPAPGQPSTTGGCWRWHMLKAETNPECVCNLCHFRYTHTPVWLLMCTSRTHEGVCLHLLAGLSVHVWVCRTHTYGWASVCMYTCGLMVVEFLLMLMQRRHFYLKLMWLEEPLQLSSLHLCGLSQFEKVC